MRLTIEVFAEEVKVKVRTRLTKDTDQPRPKYKIREIDEIKKL